MARREYPPEFRRQIVELHRAGRSVAELTREFEPGEQTIRLWIKQAEIDEGQREGLTTDEREELRRLRRENRQLKLEREILKKAAAWFARGERIAWSRRVVGWAMATHLRSELVLDALNMALWQRRPERVIHHSGQGTQYTSIAFGLRCKEAGVRPSMGSRGDCYDNALCESFFATLECELLDRRRFRNQAEARMAIFDFIESWYNPRRRHSGLGQMSPINYERKHGKAA